MKLLDVDTVSDAKRRLEDYSDRITPSAEEAGITDAAGRILSADVISCENIPPYRRSTVDGYAVKSRDVGAAGDMVPTILKITGEVLLGSDPSGLRLDPGCCIYVPTGGTVPEGADAVVMVEFCEPFGNGMLAVSKSAAPGEHIVRVGEDISEGRILLRKGRKLRSQDIGVLAASGITSVPVYIPWNVTVLSTGDELVHPGETPGPGQIRDINSYTIAARCAEEGFRVVRVLAIKDDSEAIFNALSKAKEDSDIVVMSGGSSQGKKDMSAELIGAAADCGILTHGLAAKPGKPTITGYDSKSNTVFIGLPGHPAAALMVFEQVLISLWRDLTEQPPERTIRAAVTSNLGSAPGRRTFQLVRLSEGPVIQAEPLIAKSGMISPMSDADGYFVMTENQEGVRAGDMVDVHLWK